MPLQTEFFSFFNDNILQNPRTLSEASGWKSRCPNQDNSISLSAICIIQGRFTLYFSGFSLKKGGGIGGEGGEGGERGEGLEGGQGGWGGEGGEGGERGEGGEGGELEKEEKYKGRDDI